jgi:hypothetical protein
MSECDKDGNDDDYDDDDGNIKSKNRQKRP